MMCFWNVPPRTISDSGNARREYRVSVLALPIMSGHSYRIFMIEKLRVQGLSEVLHTVLIAESVDEVSVLLRLATHG